MEDGNYIVYRNGSVLPACATYLSKAGWWTKPAKLASQEEKENEIGILEENFKKEIEILNKKKSVLEKKEICLINKENKLKALEKRLEEEKKLIKYEKLKINKIIKDKNIEKALKELNK